MVVDDRFRFLTQREHPRLALIAVELKDDHLLVNAPEMPSLVVPFAPKQPRSVAAVVWEDTVSAVDVGQDAARWFSEFLGIPSRLVFMPDSCGRKATKKAYTSPVGFADAYPLLLISEASLSDLNARLIEPVPMNRFRPNLVISGCEAYAEDTWAEISIGGIGLHVVKACARCVITTVNQTSGEKGKEPLRTLATYRSVNGNVLFGQNLIHAGKGTLMVGDRMTVIRMQEMKKGEQA